MLHTLTGNLLAEHTLDFPQNWTRAATQRAAATSFQVGGKGINVSKMLVRLNSPTRAITLADPLTGAACARWLRAKKIPCKIIPTTTPTRIGLVARAPRNEETTFLGPDAPPDARALRQLAAHLDKLPPRQALAIYGSLPGWDLPAAKPLRNAIARAAQKRPLIADTYGPPLADLVKLPLALVKINLVEFDQLLPRKNDKLPSRLLLAAKKFPVQNWIITDGPNPVWLLERDKPPQKFIPKKIKQISPTGSGDVFLALVLHLHFYGKKTLANALTAALPFAAANAAHQGVAEFEFPKKIS